MAAFGRCCLGTAAVRACCRGGRAPAGTAPSPSSSLLLPALQCKKFAELIIGWYTHTDARVIILQSSNGLWYVST